MAARRVYPLYNEPWHQVLKTSIFKKRQVLNSANSYITNLVKPTFRPQTQDAFEIKSWAKFESQNFDGIQLIAGLYKTAKIRSIGSCTFRVYAISTDNNWSETLVATLTGTAMPDGRFKASVTESMFGSLYMDGEISLRIEVDITRQNKTFNDFFYINHLGIYGNVFVLRKDVKFLELTKMDE